MGSMWEDANADGLWTVWRRLVSALPVWAMPLEWFVSPSMWTLFGADFLSGLRRNRTTSAVFRILQPLPEPQLRRLHGLAQLNHRRHEAVSRGFAVAFLTLPASAALPVSELSPATLQRIASAEGPARWYLMLAYAGAVVALYMMFAWRARQMLTLIEMWLILAGVEVRSESGDEADPVQAPIGG